MNPCTEKQLKQIQKRINFYGLDRVNEYLHKFFPDADMNNLNRVEAQKIITGIQIPVVIRGVAGRDVPW